MLVIDRDPPDRIHLEESRPTSLLEDDEPILHDHAIFTDQRHDISDRTDRRNIEQPLELINPFRHETAIQGCCYLERRPGAAQFAKRIGIRRQFWIDDRERLRQNFGNVMMINHDCLHPERSRFGDLLVVHHATIEGQDETNTSFPEAVERFPAQSMSLAQLVRDMYDRIYAEPLECLPNDDR